MGKCCVPLVVVGLGIFCQFQEGQIRSSGFVDSFSRVELFEQRIVKYPPKETQKGWRGGKKTLNSVSAFGFR
jgi:hypothetical protein